jgi:tight adherence protein C
MVDLLTAAVFLVGALGTICAGARAAGRPRAIDRLAPRPARPARAVHISPALVWRGLVKRLGPVIPASPRDLPLLKRKLIRAGLRHPEAARHFQTIRAVTAAFCAVLGLTYGLRTYAAIDRLLLETAGTAALGYLAPMQYVKFRIGRRQHAIGRGLPNALDLMVVCVESGLGIDQTTVQVAKELQTAHPEICDEFTVMNLELRAGKRREEALHNLADRTGVEDVRKLVAVLVQTDRFGTSVAQTLRGHADYLRIMARQRAEERAAKLAVKLVFPVFFCMLPSLFVVTLGPALTKLVRELVPMLKNM